jgi:hypothetical protein
MSDFFNSMEKAGIRLAISALETRTEYSWNASIRYLSNFAAKRAFGFSQTATLNDIFYVLGHLYEAIIG